MNIKHWISLLFHKKKKEDAANQKVIPFHQAASKVKAQKRRYRQQVCSRCKQQSRLTFYSNERGNIQGLCDGCRKDVKRLEELYPI